jgi:hypothetical protein
LSTAHKASKASSKAPSKATSKADQRCVTLHKALEYRVKLVKLAVKQPVKLLVKQAQTRDA